MSILIVGTSHLSLTYGLFMSRKGLKVFFHEPDERINHELLLEKIRALNEPQLIEIYEKYFSSIHILLELESLTEFEFVLVALDVKTNPHNLPDYREIEKSLEEISNINTTCTPVIILSQVFPGFTRRYLRDFPLFHMVETLVFGEALNRLENLEIFLVGVEITESGYFELPPQFVSLFKVPPNYVTYESSELAKIAINVILGFQILSANLLAHAAEEIGASWKSIEPIIRKDSRIGPYSYLRPDLGFLGGNIPRDFAVICRILSTSNLAEAKNFLDASMLFNASLATWITKKLQEASSLRKSQRIGLMGFTYKQGTSSTKNSVASILLSNLEGYTLSIFEPDSIALMEEVGAGQVTYDFELFMKSSEIIVVCRKDSRFGEMLISRLHDHVIIDPFCNIPLGTSASTHHNYWIRGGR